MAQQLPSHQEIQTLSTSLDLGDFSDPSTWAVMKLPRFFLLKGDNGKYIRTVELGLANEISADDKMDATVYEAVELADGAIGIRSNFNNLFLGSSVANVNASYAAADLNNWRNRFYPVKVGRSTDSNLIGLRLYSSMNIQGRCFREVMWDGRNVLQYNVIGSMRPDTQTGFRVEEPVYQRQIYGIQYRMQDARIYDHEPLTSVTKDVKNWSATPQKGVLSFSHTESESQSWGSTDTWKVSASVGISVRIPFVKETSITAEAYYSGAYEWGEAQETVKEIASQLEVEIPPMSMVQATMIVQKGKLEVPFSYGQKDALYDGNSFPSILQDGLFTGVNTYVTFHTIKKSLQ